jgi:hypothetical protein
VSCSGDTALHAADDTEHVSFLDVKLLGYLCHANTLLVQPQYCLLLIFFHVTTFQCVLFE